MRSNNHGIINKKHIIGFLYAMIIFYAFLGFTSVTAYLVQQLGLESALRDDSASISLCVVHLISSVLGFGMFVVCLFTDKIEHRNLVIAESIVIAVLLVIFVVSCINIDYIQPRLTFLQQIFYVSALLGIHIFDDFSSKRKSNTVDENDNNDGEEFDNIEQDLQDSTSEEIRNEISYGDE